MTYDESYRAYWEMKRCKASYRQRKQLKKQAEHAVARAAQTLRRREKRGG